MPTYLSTPESRTINDFPHPLFPSPSDSFAEWSNATISASAVVRSVISTRISKLVLVGDCGVGKTTLMNRFCHNAFDANYKATIGVDFETAEFLIRGTSFQIQMWDTAGQERFRCMARSYYRGADVIMITFDVTDRTTLDSVKNWVFEVQHSSSSPLVMFLVGTKLDLLKMEGRDDLQKDAQQVAKDIGAELWFVSSRSGENVDEMFRRIAAVTFDALISREERGMLKKVEIGQVLPSLQTEDIFETKRVKTQCASSTCRF